MFLLASALVERHGPWPTLLGFLACTTAASGGLAALLARRATTTELRFGAAYCALTFFFNGVWPVLYVVTPAAFPTDARGAGFGAANVGKQLGAVALPLVAGALAAMKENAALHPLLRWQLSTFTIWNHAFILVRLLLDQKQWDPFLVVNSVAIFVCFRTGFAQGLDDNLRKKFGVCLLYTSPSPRD